MKSLPEDELFKALEKRLENYTEEPDAQSWDKIAAAIPGSGTPTGWVWLDRAATMAALVTLGFLLGVYATSSTRVGSSAQVYKGDESSIAKTSAPRSGNIETSLFKDDKGVRNEITDAVARVPDENSKKVLTQSNIISRNSSRPGSVKDIKAADNNPFRNNTKQSDGEYNADYTSSDYRTRVGESQTHEPRDIAGKKTVIANLNDGSDNSKGNMLNNLNNNSVNGNVKSVVSSTTTKSGLGSHLIDTLKNENATALVTTDSPAVRPVPVKSIKPKSERTVQDDKDKKNQVFHPLVYVSLTPSLSYNKIVPVKNDALNVNGLSSDGIFSSNRIGYGLEVGLQHRLTRRLEIAAGLSYYQQNQQIVYQYQSSNNVEITRTNDPMVFKVTPGEGENKIDYNMRNAGVSAGLFYQIKEGKLQHKLGVGLQYQKGFLKAGGESGYDNSSSSYLNYQISYRIEYKLNNVINIFTQPNMVHSISSKESGSVPFGNKQYRAGIGFGLLYHF